MSNVVGIARHNDIKMCRLCAGYSNVILKIEAWKCSGAYHGGLLNRENFQDQTLIHSLEGSSASYLTTGNVENIGEYRCLGKRGGNSS